MSVSWLLVVLSVVVFLVTAEATNIAHLEYREEDCQSAWLQQLESFPDLALVSSRKRTDRLCIDLAVEIGLSKGNAEVPQILLHSETTSGSLILRHLTRTLLGQHKKDEWVTSLFQSAKIVVMPSQRPLSPSAKLRRDAKYKFNASLTWTDNIPQDASPTLEKYRDHFGDIPLYSGSPIYLDLSDPFPLSADRFLHSLPSASLSESTIERNIMMARTVLDLVVPRLHMTSSKLYGGDQWSSFDWEVWGCAKINSTRISVLDTRTNSILYTSPPQKSIAHYNNQRFVAKFSSFFYVSGIDSAEVVMQASCDEGTDLRSSVSINATNVPPLKTSFSHEDEPDRSRSVEPAVLSTVLSFQCPFQEITSVQSWGFVQVQSNDVKLKLCNVPVDMYTIQLVASDGSSVNLWEDISIQSLTYLNQTVLPGSSASRVATGARILLHAASEDEPLASCAFTTSSASQSVTDGCEVNPFIAHASTFATVVIGMLLVLTTSALLMLIGVALHSRCKHLFVSKKRTTGSVASVRSDIGKLEDLEVLSCISGDPSPMNGNGKTKGPHYKYEDLLASVVDVEEIPSPVHVKPGRQHFKYEELHDAYPDEEP
eukprot:GILJ01005767.1.p1 GENE.GILJ01005767.1~~GILJ01005767.1.p1  ORF type:complete len:598 (-),score=63.04 GILJ01005767.1:394-2187(-)